MSITDTIVTLVAAGMTLSILSYLYRENLFFRIAEHAYMGGAIGYGALLSADAAVRILRPHLEKGEYIWLLTVVMGMLYLFFFAKKYFYLYRYPTAIVMATGIGVFLARGVKTNLLGQARSTMLVTDVSTAIVAIGVICGLFYFYATMEPKGPLREVNRVGRWFLMAAFGAQIGLHVMARTSLIIGRIRFLFFEYPANYMIPVAIILLLVGIFQDYQKSKA